VAARERRARGGAPQGRPEEARRVRRVAANRRRLPVPVNPSRRRRGRGGRAGQRGERVLVHRRGPVAGGRVGELAEKEIPRGPVGKPTRGGPRDGGKAAQPAELGGGGEDAAGVVPVCALAGVADRQGSAAAAAPAPAAAPAAPAAAKFPPDGADLQGNVCVLSGQNR
jgi:hypothetical protein